LARLGTYIPAPNNEEVDDYLEATVSVPSSFDARTQWSSCIHPIRDQGQCGSCWAFGSTEAFSDRFCIASSGKINVVLSPEDLVSCDTTDYGCSGGYLNMAWNYLQNTGAVLDSCFPYGATSGTAPSCQAKCSDGSAWKKYKCTSNSVVHPRTVAAI